MAIPQWKSRSPSIRTYKDLAGVDFNNEPSLVTSNRSPYSVNMYKDYRASMQAIETRPGFKNLLTLGDPIYGIFFFNTLTLGLKVLVHSGNKLYLWNNFPEVGDLNNVTMLFDDMDEIKSRAFVYNNNLYLNDGKNYIFYDGLIVAKVESVAYIPTTTIARNPSGRRSNIKSCKFITN